MSSNIYLDPQARARQYIAIFNENILPLITEGKYEQAAEILESTRRAVERQGLNDFVEEVHCGFNLLIASRVLERTLRMDPTREDFAEDLHDAQIQFQAYAAQTKLKGRPDL